MRKGIDIGWLLFWGVLSSIWCLNASRELSATFDETFYMKAGLGGWRSGSNFHLMRAGTMPLPIDVQYLPIYLWEKQRGQPFDVEVLDNREQRFEVGKAVKPGQIPDPDFHTILPYARAANLIFWWLLLLYGMRLGRLFGGEWAGRLAVVVLATEPNLLGHACLASTDISVTALILTFTYHYIVGRDGGRWRRWVLPGILYGLAIAAKASAWTFIPLVMFAVELPRWYERGLFRKPEGVNWIKHLWRITSDFRFDFIKVYLLGAAVLWIYCGCDWKPQQSFVKWAANLQDSTWRERMTPIANGLAIFPNAGEALAYQIKHNMRGHGVYLFGEWKSDAIKYYFPVALSIKLSIPLLILIACSFILRPKVWLTPLGLAAILLFLFSFQCRVQIGIRLMFPLISFLILTSSVAWGQLVTPNRERSGWVMLGFLCLAFIGPAIRTWPDGIRYSNELYGGNNETYKYLSDSNYDWGQGIKELDRWTEEHDLPKAEVWYYGSDPVVARDPNRVLPLHGDQYPMTVSDDALKHVKGKIVAVGYSILYRDPTQSRNMGLATDFFKQQQPIGKTRTFLIYDFRTPEKAP